jgi:hypothetical protein
MIYIRICRLLLKCCSHLRLLVLLASDKCPLDRNTIELTIANNTKLIRSQCYNQLLSYRRLSLARHVAAKIYSILILVQFSL